MEDVSITTTSNVLNSLLMPLHGAIVKMIHASLPMIKKKMEEVVFKFNQNLTNHVKYMTKIFDPLYPMDLTMTQAPVVNGQSGLVQLNFEGVFYDSQERTTHTGRNTLYPTRVSGLNSNQFFLHETTLNSLFYALDQKYMPLHINSTNVTSQLLTLFPEIRGYYGEQVFLDLDIFL